MKKIIETYEEFGFMLWYHLPIAYHFHIKNKLKKTISRIGTKAVFYFSPNHEEIRRNDSNFRKFQICYTHNQPEFTKSGWAPPPLKKHYKNNIIKFNKPIITIHNKNTLEWGNSGIFNYFNSEALDKIFKLFYDTHKIIYIRPVDNGESVKLQKDDGQNTIDIGDLRLIKNKYPNVLWIGDMFEKYKVESYNELQFMILANSEMHIASAGEAVIPAYFGGDLLIYGCPNCNSKNRGVWKTDSWMKLLSNCKIYGYTNYNQLLLKAKELWK